jgi:hypothetical protein
MTSVKKRIATPVLEPVLEPVPGTLQAPGTGGDSGGKPCAE